MKRPLSLLALTLAVGLSGGLSACGAVSGATNAAGHLVESREGACPTISILADADTMTRFRGEGRDLPDIHFQAQVSDAVTRCSYGRAWGQRYAYARVRVDFEIELGTAAYPAPVSIPYFVAVILPDSQTVLTKEVFTIDVPLSETRRVVVLEDYVDRIAIPVDDTTGGGAYEIVVGFELSPEQLAFNRRRGY